MLPSQSSVMPLSIHNHPYASFPVMNNMQRHNSSLYMASSTCSPFNWDPRLTSHIQMMRLAQLKLGKLNPMLAAKQVKEEAPAPSIIVKVQSASPEPVLMKQKVPEDMEKSDAQFEEKITYMIQYFVDTYGKATEQEVQSERALYKNDFRLTKVFDILISKYTSIAKTREQRIKWIIRRAFKRNKQAIKGGSKNPSKKEISKNLCKRYFKDSKAELPHEEEDEEAEDELDSLLPFKKNSKNKTMNAHFLTELFESGTFRNDYEAFLEDFDEITRKDSIEKVKKFASFVVECVKKSQIDCVKKYKRVPWLNSWFQNTKKLAFELGEGNLGGKGAKMLKKED
jgi:hypothetical protein